MVKVDIIGLAFYLYHDMKLLIGVLLDLPIYLLGAVMYGIKIVYSHDIDKHFFRRNGQKPVLLLHGSGSFDAQWLPVEWFFLRDFDLYTVQLPTDSNISLFKIKIDKKINDIYEKTGQKVNLIGHSMGGLIASKYIAHPLIGHIITIATPFRGSPLLKYLKFADIRTNEMVPSSKFLTKLHHKIQKTDKFIHCFGSKYDMQVPYPWCVAYNTRYWYQLKWAGHLSIIFMPKLWKKVKVILNRNHQTPIATVFAN